MSSRQDLHFLEIDELGALLRRRELSSVEITRAQLQRISELDGQLFSYALVMADDALAAAEGADVELAAGRDRGPLHGVPIGIKDLCWAKGHPTAAGTSLHRNFIPDEDATVVARLRDAGAIILGKHELTEGAYSDHHPIVQSPRNPWNEAYWPGISSSGSGVALAAGLCYGALGTDTGGSIRWPAAANGVTGLKPSWGRVSRYGVFELAATLDHVGTMARSTRDAATLLAAVAGDDVKDPTTVAAPRNWLSTADGDICGFRIGVDDSWNEIEIDSVTQAVLTRAIETFAELGAEIVEVKLPDPAPVIADWVSNCAVEAAVAHEATYPSQKGAYGPVLAGVLEVGRALSGTAYQKILLRRMRFKGLLGRAMQKVDLILTPVQPFPPLSLQTVRTLGEQPRLIAQLQRYTCPFNMTGNPTLTLPGGFTPDGLPVGIQLIAADLREDLLVLAGAAFQQATDWHRRHPVLP
jgi:amidase